MQPVYLCVLVAEAHRTLGFSCGHKAGGPPRVWLLCSWGRAALQKVFFPGVAFNTGALLENPSVLAGLPGTLIFAGISLSVNSRLKAY